MKLILDEWIVHEVIDTLYMARTTLLGITGLDSPQEVAKKSANETAITRRISKTIDIIQQSDKQQPIPEGLEETAEAYRRESIKTMMAPNIDGPLNEYCGNIKGSFIAGAKWQKEQMIKEAVECVVVDFSSYLPRPQVDIRLDPSKYHSGDKVHIIILKEE